MRTIHWVWAASFALFAALLMAHQAGSNAPRKLESGEILKLLKAPRQVLFIDVREPNEIAVTGTLKDALTIPVGQLEQRLKEVPKDKPVVLYCLAGGRSDQAARWCTSHGFAIEAHMGGGISAWRMHGLPVVTD